MRFRGLAEARAAIVVTAAVVLACVLTYPYIFNFSNAGRLDTNDGRWSIWVVSWVAHALTTDPLQRVPRQHFLSARQRAGLFRRQLRRRRHRRAGVAADAESVRHAQLRLALSRSCCRLSRRTTWCGYLTGDRRAAVAGRDHVRLLPVRVRAPGAHPAAADRLPAVVHAGVPPLHRSHVGRPRAIELGVVLWLTGLACAYYGIFAGGMVALGTHLARRHARTLARPSLLGGMVALAAAVCIGLTAPFFLPYLQMQERRASRARSTAQYFGEHRRVAGSSAWAHRWWVPYLRAISEPSEVLFPGHRHAGPRRVGRDLRPLEPDPASRTLRRRDRRRGLVLHRLAVISFWTTFGPKAGLYTLFYYTVPVFSFLRAPSRTGIVVTLCLVVLAAPALIRLMRTQAGDKPRRSRCSSRW